MPLHRNLLECAHQTLVTAGKHRLWLHFPQTLSGYDLCHALPLSHFLTSSSHVDKHSSGWPLTDSWLPHVYVPAESLLFISPLPGQGCGEHTSNRVYLPHPHVHHSPQVTRSGTRWSLALSLPSDCRLTTRVRGGREIPPPTQGYHQRSSHLNLSIFERWLSDLR